MAYPAWFDPEWYLLQYPDVAAAGIEPWVHFDAHGRNEGRFGHEAHVLAWFDEAAFGRLRTLFNRLEPNLGQPDLDYFRWLIARRYAATSSWRAVLTTLEPLELDRDAEAASRMRKMAQVLWIDALIKAGESDAARQQLQRLDLHCPGSAESVLLQANLLQYQQEHSSQIAVDWLEIFNRLYLAQGLAAIGFRADGRLCMDDLQAQSNQHFNGALVSVLMPARNAAKTIKTAINSVLAQSWASLELIVVDDASSDATAEVVRKLAGVDDRVRLLQLTQAQGPYAARNHALDAALGSFVTVHDADDWSHPQKIEYQLKHLMQRPQLQGCFTSWVRARSDLMFGIWDLPSTWAGWVHRNTSSLLLKRSLFNAVGYWDELTCNADSEFIDRIKTAWGACSLEHILPQIPLAFGRSSEGGLTQQKDTHLLTALKGPRLEHMRAYTRWHRAAATPEDLYMPRRPERRPYPVPSALLPRAD